MLQRMETAMADWKDHPLFRKYASLPAISGEEVQRVTREFLPKVLSVARHIPFAEEALAAFHAATDPEVPSTARAMMWGPLLYFVLPIDGIPDIIPGAGFLDDAALFALMLRSVQSAIGPQHRAKARETLGLPPRAAESSSGE